MKFGAVNHLCELRLYESHKVVLENLKGLGLCPNFLKFAGRDRAVNLLHHSDDCQLDLAYDGPGALQSRAPGPIVLRLIAPIEQRERERRHTPPRLREADGGASLLSGSVV
jgi:hypothetical protein